MSLKIEVKNTSSNQSIQSAKQGLDQLLKRSDLGFFNLPHRNDLIQATEELVQDLVERRQITDLVLVGIGGSAMGPQVIRDFFQRPSSARKIHFIDNVDLRHVEDLLASLPDLQRTAWAFISKSGSTLETLSVLELLHLKLGKSFFKNSIVVSEPRENPLTSWAQKNQVPQLEIPVNVGGRFSVFSAVGLLPAAFLGVSLERIRQGCLRSLENKALVMQVSAQALESFQRKEAIISIWSYSSSLRSFGGWFQQLWAESLGKAQDRAGLAAPFVSTPVPQVGSCDQHSVLQQVMEGARDKWVIFQRVLELEKRQEPVPESLFGETSYWKGKSLGEILAAEAWATEEALSSQGISTLRLSVKDLGPESFGELLMFWQLVVGTLGECLNIDAFNQPGVELGKKLMKEALKA